MMKQVRLIRRGESKEMEAMSLKKLRRKLDPKKNII